MWWMERMCVNKIIRWFANFSGYDIPFFPVHSFQVDRSTCLFFCLLLLRWCSSIVQREGILSGPAGGRWEARDSSSSFWNYVFIYCSSSSSSSSCIFFSPLLLTPCACASVWNHAGAGVLLLCLLLVILLLTFCWIAQQVSRARQTRTQRAGWACQVQ